MRAAILSIGDELTLGQNIDTNSPWIAAKLAERSILTIEQRTVADDRQSIAKAIAELAKHHDLLMITGGLGPTEDDLTREALADVIAPGQEMVMDETALAEIARRFERSGRAMPEMNRKQALRPKSARCLPNPHGTAPGLAGAIGQCRVYTLPGPPPEMQPMFLEYVLGEIADSKISDVIVTAAVHEIGMGESDAAERLGSLMDRRRNPLVGVTVSNSIVSAKIRATGPAQQMRLQLDETISEIRRLWHPYAFGVNEESLAKVVGDLLRTANRKLVSAESCTGGWLGKEIVDVAGSSDYFLGGWVTYSNAMKVSELSVDATALDTCGAVSAPVAAAMAEGALNAAGADESLAITGIAGPPRTDQPSEKPVGTVFIALARKHDDQIETVTRHFLFPGNRSIVRDRSVKAALQIMRLALIDVTENAPLLWEAGPIQRSEKISIEREGSVAR